MRLLPSVAGIASFAIIFHMRDADGTVFKYNLLLTRALDDAWCMMEDASTAINVTWPQVRRRALVLLL